MLAADVWGAEVEVPADIVVAADGSGDFTTVQAAVASIPRDSHERIIVLVKDGVYTEKVRIDADCVTLRGESRDGTRIEFEQLNDDFTAQPDELGRAVINVEGDDFVMENLTVENTASVVGKHAFTVYGSPDRTVVGRLQRAEHRRRHALALERRRGPVLPRAMQHARGGRFPLPARLVLRRGLHVLRDEAFGRDVARRQ